MRQDSRRKTSDPRLETSDSPVSSLKSEVSSRRVSLNSFLISLALNLALLLTLSLYRENTAPQSKDSVVVKFVSLPKTKVERRSLTTLPRFLSPNIQDTPSAQVNVRVTKEVVAQASLPVKEVRNHSNPELPMDIAPTDSPNSLPSSHFPVSSLSDSTGKRERGGSVLSRSTGPGSSGRGVQRDRRIVPRQPKAMIGGSGDKLTGYYNISLVRYEDTSDVISAGALTQLAGAMNRWTQIRTKVIREPIMLDDPELLDVPLVYITSRRPFAFSERERENLQRYFANGGFLLFSNAADSDSEARGVANSIEFELWKVLGGIAHDLADISKEHQTSSSPSLEEQSASSPSRKQSVIPPLEEQSVTPPLKNQSLTPPFPKGAGGIYRGFFDLRGPLGLRGIVLNGRVSVIYEDSGYGAGWIAGRDSKREPYLKLGVNIIVYALTTSPIVRQD